MVGLEEVKLLAPPAKLKSAESRLPWWVSKTRPTLQGVTQKERFLNHAEKLTPLGRKPNAKCRRQDLNLHDLAITRPST